MKKVVITTLVLASMLSATTVLAQHKADDMKCCKDMKDMDMKNMDMKQMDMGKKSAPGMKTHHAVGVVKALDATAGTVTLAHEPVKSLNWPAMSMSFGVKDKMLFDKLAEGKKVEFEFMKEGKGYVVTAVK
ncbi:MAG: copper-binding protein [Betaproteobacteria bacterium]|nr:copper-binding protein [Betaproteobacteria bacterium]